MTKPAQDPTLEQFAAFVEHFRTSLAPLAQRMAEQVNALTAAMAPLAEYAQQHPEAFAQQGAELQHCHCLCGRHPASPGVCTGYAPQGLTVRFNSPTVGAQDVPMCRNCHEAHQGRQPQREALEADNLEAVTDTCKCHCWKNHPGQAGVCEAGSTPGYEIDNSPACAPCSTAASE